MSSKKIVMKFGGASLESSLRIKNTANIIKKYSSESIVVIVSAIGDSTNRLIEAGKKAFNGEVSYHKIKNKHKEICETLTIDFELLEPLFNSLELLLIEISKEKKLDSKMLDALMSFGERMAAIILSQVLIKMELKSLTCNSWDIGLISNDKHQDAEILKSSKRLVRLKVENHLNKGLIPVITGFISKDKNGEITTLGRGASDLTASYVGASIDADKIILWKDVDGILSSNPRIVKNTIKINEISYQEAADMAYYGAEVIHPLALLPAQQKNIEIVVKNFLDPLANGTKIYNVAKESMNSRKIKTISYRQNLKIVHIIPFDGVDFLNFYEVIYSVLKELKIPTEMLSMEKSGVSFLINEEFAIKGLKNEMKDIADVEVLDHMAIISLIGETKETSKIFSEAFNLLNTHLINIKMISSGVSYRNISFIVKEESLVKAINLLHDKLVIVK